MKKQTVNQEIISNKVATHEISTEENTNLQISQITKDVVSLSDTRENSNEPMKNVIKSIKELEVYPSTSLEFENIYSLSENEIRNLQYHPYLEMFPNANNVEKESLKTSILNVGILEPIVLTKENVVLSGRFRISIYLENPKKLRLTCKILKEGLTPEEFIFRDNIQRKQISNGAKAILSVKTYEYILERRKTEKNFTFNGLNIEDFDRSRDVVAKIFGIGATYITYANHICANNADLAEAVLKGTITLNNAYDISIGKNSEISDEVDTDEDYKTNNMEVDIEAKVEVINDEIVVESIGSDANQKNSEKNKKTSEFTKDYFVQKKRKLEPIEEKFLDFLTNTFPNSKIEEQFIKMLVEEFEISKRKQIESDDEKFNIFIESYTALVEFNNKEKSLFINKIKKLKEKFKKENIIELADRIRLFKTNFDIQEQILIKAVKKYQEKVNTKIDIEETLYHKLTKFLLDNSELIKSDKIEVSNV
jgi:hypothetical protein